MISSADISQTKHWIDRFRDIHASSIPMRMTSKEVDPSGGRQWSPELRSYLTGDDDLKPWQHDSDQRRLKRALKRVRERSIREYEVLHRVLELGESVADITAWLNQRAIRGGHPERYTTAATVVIIFAAVHKLQEWY